MNIIERNLILFSVLIGTLINIHRRHVLLLATYPKTSASWTSLINFAQRNKTYDRMGGEKMFEYVAGGDLPSRARCSKHELKLGGVLALDKALRTK